VARRVNDALLALTRTDTAIGWFIVFAHQGNGPVVVVVVVFTIMIQLVAGGDGLCSTFYFSAWWRTTIKAALVMFGRTHLVMVNLKYRGFTKFAVVIHLSLRGWLKVVDFAAKNY
jgi:hypothetical protein